ncbi:MAG: hypothetical protein WAU88_08785 [Candidatus Zixiibacteriota bacterium]
MRRILTILSIAVLLAGCGFNPEKKAYDTAANPQGFPQKALHLVDGVESGELGTIDSITAVFSDLYTENPELLDNPDWRTVVTRLGAKFKFKAEQYSSQGPASFDQAADFYTLASFARPEDSRLAARKNLFETWGQAVDDSMVSPTILSDTHPASLSEKLTLLKYFMLSDSVHREFGQTYLLPQLIDVRMVSNALKSDSAGGISLSDRCFLLSLGFKGKLPSQSLATFSEPKMDLTSVRISKQAGSWYAAELYFIPREKIESDFHIAFRLAAPDSSNHALSVTKTLDFLPEDKTTKWHPGSVVAAYRRFTFDGSPSQVQVGLYEKSADSVHFVPLRDSGSPLYIGSPSLFDRR